MRVEIKKKSNKNIKLEKDIDTEFAKDKKHRLYNKVIPDKSLKKNEITNKKSIEEKEEIYIPYKE